MKERSKHGIISYSLHILQTAQQYKNPPTEGGFTVQAVLKDNTSIIRPELEVVENVTAYNYAYIPAFSRYYFVQDVIWEREYGASFYLKMFWQRIKR